MFIEKRNGYQIKGHAVSYNEFAGQEDALNRRVLLEKLFGDQPPGVAPDFSIRLAHRCQGGGDRGGFLDVVETY